MNLLEFHYKVLLLADFRPFWIPDFVEGILYNRSSVSVSVLVSLSKISVTVPTIFLKLWENEEETISRIVTEPFFAKKLSLGSRGQNGGFFGSNCR